MYIFEGYMREKVGQVSIHKTKYYLLEFVWDSSGKWYLSKNQYHLSLTSPGVRRTVEILPKHHYSRIIYRFYPDNNKKTAPDNLLVDWQSTVRTHQERRRIVLFTTKSKKTSWIPIIWHHHDCQQIPVCWVTITMQIRTILRYLIKHPNRYFPWTCLSTGPKNFLHLWHSRSQAHKRIAEIW